MERPNKSWCLYLTGIVNLDGVDISKYDGCIGEELSRDDNSALVRIYDKLGYRKDEVKHDTIYIPIENLKLGYLSKKDTDYFKYCLVLVNTSYFNNDQDWIFKSVFGHNNVLNKLIENDGLIDDELVESIATLDETKWFLVKGKVSYFLMPYSIDMYKDLDFIEVSSLKALKYFGLIAMEDAIERTQTYISTEIAENAKNKEKSIERDDKLNKLI